MRDVNENNNAVHLVAYRDWTKSITRTAGNTRTTFCVVERCEASAGFDGVKTANLQSKTGKTAEDVSGNWSSEAVKRKSSTPANIDG